MSGSRFLYVEHGELGDSLAIRDAQAGHTEPIAMPDGRTVLSEAAFLTPSGAIFVTQAVDGNVLSSRLYLWSRGVSTDLGYPNSAGSLRVSGDYAIWNEDTDLYRLDTRCSTPELLATDAGNWRNSVATDGTVAYWNLRYNVVLIQGGTPTVITSDPSQWHTYPSTDGRVTVYRKHDPCCLDQQYQIEMFDGASTVQLSARRSGEPSQDRDYLVRNGWIAYTDIGNLGQLHVWTRSPAGALLRHTDLGSTSGIDVLADDGGDTVQNTIGVLGYDFSLYRIVLTGPADYAAVNPRPVSPEPVGGAVRVAAMNTLNFFVTADYPSGNPLDNKCGPLNNVECRGWDRDQADEFTRQRTKLCKCWLVSMQMSSA